MTLAPARPFQTAQYQALTMSVDMIAAFGAAAPRVYDTVPPNPTFPYVVIGDDQILDDSHCKTAFEVNSTVHVFARAGGLTIAKQIGDAIIATLGTGELAVAGFQSMTSEIENALTNTTYFYEPDGITAHGVLAFRYMLEAS